MTKQTKREELNIGVNGLKINNLFTNKLKTPFDGVELKLIEGQYELPSTWSERAQKEATSFFYPEEISGDDEQPQNETSITQVINRVVEAWRWWGDSYSYFNRKTDALNFSNELKYILCNRIASPNLSCWQCLGIRQTYGIRGEAAEGVYFIDPDTNNVYAARDSFTHPQILTKDNGKLVADFYIDTTHPVWQDEQLANHVVRLITIAQDICILASGYPSQQAAEESLTNRYISFGLVPESKDLADKVMIEAISTSAELASVLSGNLDAANAAASQLDNLGTPSDLVKEYGARNFVDIATYSVQIPDFLKNTLTQVEPQDEPIAITKQESVTKIKPERSEEIKTHSILSGLNSITQEFTVGGISGYLILIPESHRLIIHSNRHDLEQEGTMKIFSKILSLYLRNHLEVQELEEIVGMSTDENINQMQKFVIDWVRKLN